jgi:hypothetical protein
MKLRKYMPGLFCKQRLIVALVLVLSIASASQAQAQEAQHDLYLVTAGISTYLNSPLNCAAKDAWDVGKLFQAQEGKLFRKVNVTPLFNFKAAGCAILNSVSNVRLNADKDSYVILYLSGHGGKDENGEYIYCAADMNLTWSQIQKVLQGMPGTVIVILDTCAAGTATGGDNLLVFCATEGDKSAFEEGDQNGNGYFTKALLEALGGSADANGDGTVTVGEVKNYIDARLNEISGGAQMETVLSPLGGLPDTLPLAVVAAASPSTRFGSINQRAFASRSCSLPPSPTDRWTGLVNCSNYRSEFWGF